MPKIWLSVEEQVAQLRDRGLSIDNEHECLQFLSHVSYYRFSGYFRYWQKSPETGDNRFISGASFSTIHDVYTTEQAVATLPRSARHNRRNAKMQGRAPGAVKYLRTLKVIQRMVLKT